MLENGILTVDSVFRQCFRTLSTLTGIPYSILSERHPWQIQHPAETPRTVSEWAFLQVVLGAKGLVLVISAAKWPYLIFEPVFGE